MKKNKRKEKGLCDGQFNSVDGEFESIEEIGFGRMKVRVKYYYRAPFLISRSRKYKLVFFFF